MHSSDQLQTHRSDRQPGSSDQVTIFVDQQVSAEGSQHQELGASVVIAIHTGRLEVKPFLLFDGPCVFESEDAVLPETPNVYFVLVLWDTCDAVFIWNEYFSDDFSNIGDPVRLKLRLLSLPVFVVAISQLSVAVGLNFHHGVPNYERVD